MERNTKEPSKQGTVPKETHMSSFNQNIIKHKIGLLNLEEELGNFSRACKLMGFSRDTFYRYHTKHILFFNWITPGFCSCITLIPERQCTPQDHITL